MNFDLGEVLTYAWQIAWKNKVLWLVGGVFGLFFSILFPLMMVPAFLPVILRSTDLNRAGGFLIVGFFLFFILFFLFMFPFSAFMQIVLTRGILNVAQDAGELSIKELIRESRPYFLKVLGLLLLYSLATTLITFMVQGVVMLLTILTLGFGMLCAMPLMMLSYPAMFFAIVWMEQAMNGIVIDDFAMMDAVRQDWFLIRKNLLPIGLMALVVYFGVGMVSGALMMPFMAPIFIIPFSFVENNNPNWAVLSISFLCMLASAPIFALIFGWIMTFTKSAWVVTYLRLTRSAGEPQPILQESAA